jgi:tRNA(Ile)-lysidine synthase
MLNAFNRFIAGKNLCNKKQRILLAVSGGMDSVVMAELFIRSGYTTGLAHINFGLRGKESDGDQKFAENLAKKYNIPFYTQRFNTAKEAAENKVSIQMEARSLRYEWLEDVRKKNKFHCIAVGHHLQDLVETMLINLLRGTGISGLQSLQAVNGKIIRPLLFARKEEIASYAAENKLKWREDSSNESDDYLRNLLRHKVLPVFKKVNPSFEDTFARNARYFSGASVIVNEYVQHAAEHLLQPASHGELQLPKIFFTTHPAGETLLYEMLKGYDFSPAVTEDIFKSIGQQPGKIFYSLSHQLVSDRENFILSPLVQQKEETLMQQFDDRLEMQHDNFILKIFPLKADKKLLDSVTVNKNKKIAYADAAKITLPVSVRTWKHGDTFYPFGMSGKKKLSDFYTDLKLSLTAKERTYLLTDAEKIIWIMGHRTDRRVAITAETKLYYRFEYTER